MSKKFCNFKKDIHEPSSSHILIILGHRQNLKTQATKFLSNTNTFQPNLYHVRLQCKYYIIFLQLHLVRQHLGWPIIDKHLQIEPKRNTNNITFKLWSKQKNVWPDQKRLPPWTSSLLVRNVRSLEYSFVYLFSFLWLGARLLQIVIKCNLYAQYILVCRLTCSTA